LANASGNTISELFVSDAVLENNGTTFSGGGIIVVPAIANGITRVTLNRVEARDNFFGIKADGVNGGVATGVINMTVRDSVSSGNRSNGIGASNGGQLVSLQDNTVILNSTNGTPTSVASPE
jgi:hypothetical protein